MKKVRRPSSKISKPRRWYTFSWLLLPLLVLAVAIALLFYYFVFPYSSRFNKNPKTSSDKNIKKESDQDIKKLKFILLSKSLTTSDDPSKGAELQLTLTASDDRPIDSQGDTIVTLSSSSPNGGFEGGEQRIISRGNSSARLRYFDTQAGRVVLTAFVSDLKPVSLELVFSPGEVAGISTILINGAEKNSVKVDSENSFSASVVDRFGNVILGQSVIWSLASQSVKKTVKENAAGRSIFSAIFNGPAPRSETVTASFGQIARNLVFTVEP